MYTPASYRRTLKRGWDRAAAEQPYHITRADGGPVSLAGLFETGAAPDDDPAFTIVTIEPNELMRGVHNRMPVVLEPESIDAWISAARASSELLRPRRRRLAQQPGNGSHLGDWDPGTRIATCTRSAGSFELATQATTMASVKIPVNEKKKLHGVL